MAGYSGTPLVKKLGIKEGFRIFLFNSPKDFQPNLVSLPDKVKIETRSTKGLDLIMLFADSEKILKKEFGRLAKLLVPNGMLWVAWPKKSSGVKTDLAFENVQRIGLDAGLVDVKICAVDEVWSGLKFVYRLKDRKSE
jgi:hypothetical protein